MPFLAPLISATGELPLPSPTNNTVADSAVRIVVGQMLSRLAAQTILDRMNARAEEKQVLHLYQLDDADLRRCGLSGRKTRTVKTISELATKENHRLESWRRLSWPELRQEVSSVWGLGEWSAAMLAIFEFGLPDVFPLSDGSLVRAMRLIEQEHLGEDVLFPHEKGSPFGSYLAITLWSCLDNGYLQTKEAIAPIQTRLNVDVLTQQQNGGV